mgnify:CR=1 FL=1
MAAGLPHANFVLGQVMIQTRFLLLSLVVLALTIACSKPNLPAATPTPSPSPTPTSSREQVYNTKVDTLVDRFYNHRRDYNSGLERIGVQVRSARTEAEQRKALEEAVKHLEAARGWFHQDRDEFALLLPPVKFQEFHLLMNRALNDYVEATTAFVTYYSQNLSQGTQDLLLANRASSLLRTANENLQRAGYMYAELLGKK